MSAEILGSLGHTEGELEFLAFRNLEQDPEDSFDPDALDFDAWVEYAASWSRRTIESETERVRGLRELKDVLGRLGGAGLTPAVQANLIAKFVSLADVAKYCSVTQHWCGAEPTELFMCRKGAISICEVHRQVIERGNNRPLRRLRPDEPGLCEWATGLSTGLGRFYYKFTCGRCREPYRPYKVPTDATVALQGWILCRKCSKGWSRDRAEFERARRIEAERLI